METELLTVVQRTTNHINDFFSIQNGDNKQQQSALAELVQTLFDQFKEIAQAHSILLSHASKALKNKPLDFKIYEMNDLWVKIQDVVSKITQFYV